MGSSSIHSENDNSPFGEASRKRMDFIIGIGFYILWYFIVAKLNIFTAYFASIPLYAIFLIAILILAFTRKHPNIVFGYICGTAMPLFFYVIAWERNVFALGLYAVVVAVCIFKLFKVD